MIFIFIRYENLYVLLPWDNHKNMIPFSETSSKPLTKGDVCLAYWTNDECYYDGTVLKRNRSNIIIQPQKDKTSCTVEKNIKTRRDIIPVSYKKLKCV